MAKTAGQVLEEERNAEMLARGQAKPTGDIAPEDPPKKGVDVNIPTPIIRFLVYMALFLIVTIPFFLVYLTVWQWFSLTALLAHFSGQLNAIKNDK